MENKFLLKKQISKLKSLMYIAMVLSQKDIAEEYRKIIVQKTELLEKIDANVKEVAYKFLNKKVYLDLSN